MKKLMVLKTKKEDMKSAKKQAKVAKKLHEKLWGKNTCEVLVLEEGQELYIVADDGWDQNPSVLPRAVVNVPATSEPGDVPVQTC